MIRPLVTGVAACCALASPWIAPVVYDATKALWVTEYQGRNGHTTRIVSDDTGTHASISGKTGAGRSYTGNMTVNGDGTNSLQFEVGGVRMTCTQKLEGTLTSLPGSVPYTFACGLPGQAQNIAFRGRYDYSAGKTEGQMQWQNRTWDNQGKLIANQVCTAWLDSRSADQCRDAN